MFNRADYKVAIVGAGWYGCQIASDLIDLGFDVTVFESGDEIFNGASGKNQYRLHQGFHYPRSKATRIQSLNGYNEFVKRYPGFSSEVAGKNLYLVPFKDSLTDFSTFVDIMKASGLNFEIGKNNLTLNNIENSIECSERVINTSKAISFFKDFLGDRIRLSSNVSKIKKINKAFEIDGEVFDSIVDATWGKLDTFDNIYFEPTLLLYLDNKNFSDALTLVDGNLWSLYPTEYHNISTLSHVEHTRLGKFSSFNEAKSFINTINNNDLNNISNNMINAAAINFPDIKEMKVTGFQLSIKTKEHFFNDQRVASIKLKNGIISVFAGKIDAMFEVSNQVCELVLLNVKAKNL